MKFALIIVLNINKIEKKHSYKIVFFLLCKTFKYKYNNTIFNRCRYSRLEEVS